MFKEKIKLAIQKFNQMSKQDQICYTLAIGIVLGRVEEKILQKLRK